MVPHSPPLSYLIQASGFLLSLPFFEWWLRVDRGKVSPGGVQRSPLKSWDSLNF